MTSAVPAIPLFGDAYLADTRHLSLEEHGAYLQLMMIAWRIEGCCLPNDDARLARMLGTTAAKWKKLKPTVMAFWTLNDGAWKQARLSKERKFVEEKRAKNKASAETRWANQPVENKGSDGCERISERNAPPPPPPESKKEEEATPPLRAAPQPIAEAVSDWNEGARIAGWPTITVVSEGRRRALAARLREHGIGGWRAALIRARSSPYLGRDPPAWFTFNWIIKPDNFLKLIEGNYDRNRANDQQKPSAWGVARDVNRVRPDDTGQRLLEQHPSTGGTEAGRLG